MTRTASLSTIAWRARSMANAVRSILPQVDRLNVFLQGYADVPAFLNHPRISVLTDRDAPESAALGGTAKFHWLWSGLVEPGYHFTIDDDIAFPSDYVESCVRKIDEHSGRVVVGFHGAIHPPLVRDLFRDRVVWNFADACPTDVYVHTIGTGTLAHHTSAFSISVADFPERNADDVLFAIAMQRQRVPMLCMRRRAGYLKSDASANRDSRSVSNHDGQGERLAGIFNRWENWEIHV